MSKKHHLNFTVDEAKLHKNLQSKLSREELALVVGGLSWDEFLSATWTALKKALPPLNSNF